MEPLVRKYSLYLRLDPAIKNLAVRASALVGSKTSCDFVVCPLFSALYLSLWVAAVLFELEVVVSNGGVSEFRAGVIIRGVRKSGLNLWTHHGHSQ